MDYKTILLKSRKDAYTKKLNELQDKVREGFSNYSIVARVSGNSVPIPNVKEELLSMGYISLKHLLRDCNRGVLMWETVKNNNIKLVDELANKFLSSYTLENTLDNDTKFIPYFRIGIEDIITPEKALLNIEKMLLDVILETIRGKDINEQFKERDEANNLFKEIFNDYMYEFVYKEDEKCLVLMALKHEQYLELNKTLKIVF